MFRGGGGGGGGISLLQCLNIYVYILLSEKFGAISVMFYLKRSVLLNKEIKITTLCLDC